MRLWKLEADLGEYESFKLAMDDKVFLRDMRKEMSNGERKKGKFDNLKIEMIDSGKSSDLPPFWNLIGALVFSEKAKKCLESHLKDCVEFIPLKYGCESYYLLNVIRIVDAIDYDNAVLRKLDTGLVVGIEKYSFIEDKVKNICMFKVLLGEKIYNSETYISSELKEMIEECNLLGFKFTEVWESNK